MLEVAYILSVSVMRQPSPLERGRGMWRIIPECLIVSMPEVVYILSAGVMRQPSPLERGRGMPKMCVVAYPEAVVGGEGVEDLVGAPLKRGSRGGGVWLARVLASVVRQPSPLERGRGMFFF